MPNRTGRLFLAVTLIIAGLFFSIVLYMPGTIRAETWWPAFVLVPGLTMLTIGLIGALTAGRGIAPLAIPGCIVSTVGAILLYTNTTGRWETWSYIWTLIPASVGLGILITSRFGTDGSGSTGAGLWLLVAGLVAFAVLGGFFEGLVFGGALSRWWPAALIILGLIVLFTARPGGRRG